MNSDPKWLRFLERRMEWLGIPHISIILITLQAFGFFLVYSDPLWTQRLALLPELVLHGGEPWRLLTFLALPVSLSPIWAIFTALFLYSILNSVEAEWGAFKTTFYVLVSVVLTQAFSLLFDYPVFSVSDFTSTLFLAAAALFPDQEVRLYLILPVKMKYLGYLAIAFVVYRLFQGQWVDRFFLLTIYSNYLLFFGPQILYQVRQWKKQRDNRARWKSGQ